MNKQGKVLISSRPSNKDFHGFYEFPGGKVEPGEYLIEATRRELFEELGIKIDLNHVYHLISYKVNQRKKNLKLNFFICNKWTGEVEGKEGQNFFWIFPNELLDYKMLKTNKKIIEYLIFRIFPSTNRNNFTTQLKTI